MALLSKNFIIRSLQPLIRTLGDSKSAGFLVIRTFGNCKEDGLPVLEMFTKEDCSLCDEAIEKLEPFRHLFVLKKVDITLAENKAWFDRYKYDIPVFHLEGKYLMRHRVHQGLLRKKLNKFT
ncbi:glutaredoxin-like protein C5orf63 homolog [Dendronephthya gigantea]|uniref:glutaredoxin-like protein C5orf63 homolog n=1 Tax=Dendronephthya gigantea TaxID=151771 RepID=UPI001068ED4F|nr:glutaredoxin-like protein C5orf63 homolog [Dendronephthya gigantea]